MDVANSTQRPLQSYMNKKRFHQIQSMLHDASPDNRSVGIEEVLSVIQTVLKFDPNDDAYMKRRLELLHKRAKEKGISTYDEMGGRACYQRRKQRALEKGT